MATLAYNLPDYRNWVMMSSKKRLLVEGPDDKRLFKLLFDAIGVPRSQIDIDSAESLVDVPGNGGNRSKVEAACMLISPLPFSIRFAGFVDREYRSFQESDSISDLNPQHNVIGRLVWSRGHSIENYYFDFAVLREPLRSFSVTECFDAALDVFEPLVSDAIAVACALGLAARDTGLQTLVRGSLDWSYFGVGKTALAFNDRVWREGLISRQRLDSVRAEALVTSFAHWHRAVHRSQADVVRWMCDGHLGLAALWAAYGASVACVCVARGCPNIPREVSRVLGASESVRFNACAESWSRRALGGQVTFPTEVVSLLGFTPHSLGSEAA